MPIIRYLFSQRGLCLDTAQVTRESSHNGSAMLVARDPALGRFWPYCLEEGTDC
jgi:hypothetical protein